MYRDHSVGVVVPAYNEEGFIGKVIEEMPDYVDRIYVIDDCSTDGTWDEIFAVAEAEQSDRIPRPSVAASNGTKGERINGDQSGLNNDRSDIHGDVRTDGGLVNEGLIAERATVYDPIGRVLPIKHEKNRGAGGAIKTGYLVALADQIDLIVTVDGDGQMDLEQMSLLLDPLVDGKADYAKGNRLLFQNYREEMPKWRFLGNSILTFLTKIASGYWKTMDPQNGYTAITHRALNNVGIENLYEYYGYCNDLLVKLNAKGLRVADVAIPAVYGDEESSISYPSYIKNVSGMLLRDFLWRLKTKYLVLDFHPLAFFYLFGAIMMPIGVFGAGWSVYAMYALDKSLFVRGSLSLMIFTIGSMFLMFAMLFDMQVNESSEVQIHNEFD